MPRPHTFLVGHALLSYFVSSVSRGTCSDLSFSVRPGLLLAVLPPRWPRSASPRSSLHVRPEHRIIICDVLAVLQPTGPNPHIRLTCAIDSCHDMGRGIVELDRRLNRGRPLLGPSDSSRTTRDGADGAVEQIQIRIWRGDQEARYEKRRNIEVEMTSIGQRLILDR